MEILLLNWEEEYYIHVLVIRGEILIDIYDLYNKIKGYSKSTQQLETSLKPVLQLKSELGISFV